MTAIELRDIKRLIRFWDYRARKYGGTDTQIGHYFLGCVYGAKKAMTAAAHIRVLKMKPTHRIER